MTQKVKRKSLRQSSAQPTANYTTNSVNVEMADSGEEMKEKNMADSGEEIPSPSRASAMIMSAAVDPANETPEHEAPNTKPSDSWLNLQIDGFLIAPPILEENLSCCQKSRFRVAQLVNWAIIVVGTYITLIATFEAIEQYDNEKINPSTSIAYDEFPEMKFPQIIICTWGYLAENSIKCTLTQQLPTGEPLCYNADGTYDPYAGPQADPSHASHWSQGKSLGAPCYNEVEGIAEAYDCTPDVKLFPTNHFQNDDETCFTINGPAADTNTKIKTIGNLKYPFVALNAGWQNQIAIEFAHNMTDAICVDEEGEAAASTSNLDCYFTQQSYGVYWQMLPNSKTITAHDTDNVPYILEADRYYLHSMTKKKVVNQDKPKKETSYWYPVSTSSLQRQRAGDSMSYNMGFFYSDISVEVITLKNSFGVINIVEAVGGASGLLLGLSSLSFLAWGMAACGIRGWSEEAPEGPFPRKYV